MTDLAERSEQAEAASTAAASVNGAVAEGRALTHGFSVVIPAKNEGAAVRGVVEQVCRTMDGTGEPYEVIVVDDGSTDATAEEARAGGAAVIQHPQNAGYGASLKTGISRARFDHVVITDADATYPIDRIPDLVAEAGRFDMVVGARQGRYYRESWRKQLSRFMLGSMASFVTGTKIPDVNSGLRVFRTDLARQYFHVISQGYSFTTSITLAALSNGYFVKYVPIEYHQRVGKSGVRLVRDGLRTAQMVMQAIVYYNPIKLFLAFALVSLALAIVCWVVYAFTLLGAVGVAAALWTVSVVHFIALGMVADLIRVRYVPRAPTLTSQR